MNRPTYIFTFIFLLFGLLKLNGQTAASHDTIVVKAAVSKITVIPEKSFLFLNEDNLFQIKYKGKNKMGKVELKGGTVEMHDSLYNLKATKGVSAILVVYEKLKNGTEQILYTWTFKLFGRDVPLVSLDGVANDSFADKFTVIALGKLRAKQKYGNDVYQVVSFTMYFKTGNHFDTLRSTTNQMTPEMKKCVDAMDIKTKGGMLLFDDIKAKGPNGTVIDLPPLRVFLQDGKRILIGM